MSLALKIWLIVFYTICIIALVGITICLYFIEFWTGAGATIFLIFMGIGIRLLVRWTK